MEWYGVACCSRNSDTEPPSHLHVKLVRDTGELDKWGEHVEKAHDKKPLDWLDVTDSWEGGTGAVC